MSVFNMGSMLKTLGKMKMKTKKIFSMKPYLKREGTRSRGPASHGLLTVSRRVKSIPLSNAQKATRNAKKTAEKAAKAEKIAFAKAARTAKKAAAQALHMDEGDEGGDEGDDERDAEEMYESNRNLKKVLLSPRVTRHKRISYSVLAGSKLNPEEKAAKKAAQEATKAVQKAINAQKAANRTTRAEKKANNGLANLFSGITITRSRKNRK